VTPFHFLIPRALLLGCIQLPDARLACSAITSPKRHIRWPWLHVHYHLTSANELCSESLTSVRASRKTNGHRSVFTHDRGFEQHSAKSARSKRTCGACAGVAGRGTLLKTPTLRIERLSRRQHILFADGVPGTGLRSRQDAAQPRR
jgi:hypothetical protein